MKTIKRAEFSYTTASEYVRVCVCECIALSPVLLHDHLFDASDLNAPFRSSVTKMQLLDAYFNGRNNVTAAPSDDETQLCTI